MGVDINEEAIEIARLSLWLHTAKKGRKLSNLSNNIKCGNSLIDDASVAGDKAFVCKEEFKTVFKEKDKKAFHTTTATHDSRTSERMIKYKVGRPPRSGFGKHNAIVTFFKRLIRVLRHSQIIMLHPAKAKQKTNVL